MSKASMGESPRTVDRNRGPRLREGGKVRGPNAWTGPYSRHLSIGTGGSLQMERAEGDKESQEMNPEEKTRKDWRDSGGLIRSRR
jgi:hypothetical protein